MFVFFGFFFVVLFLLLVNAIGFIGICMIKLFFVKMFNFCLGNFFEFVVKLFFLKFFNKILVFKVFVFFV